jgi:protein disulfide-isomerase-like protein
LFVSNSKQSAEVSKVLGEVSTEVKGLATCLSVDCESKEGKKLCKKMKVTTAAYMLKHYKDGDFHKDYDRAVVVKSMVTFLKDPSGDLPWDEDPAAQDVVHWQSPLQFNKFIKAEKGKVLAMFYAPWCGHCKRMKPDYQAAAKELKGSAVLAAMDVNKPENSPVAKKYNVTGFPTLLYFEAGQYQFVYPGDNNKAAIKAFLADPKPEAAEKPKETEWAQEPSEVVHLTEANFESFLESEPSVLVMFYAPWCGHCKRAKPHFVTAAAKMAAQRIPGKLAAVDCTKHQQVSKRFEVKGFPTIKYFKNGEMAFDAGDAREEAAILKFMADPKEPPPPPPPEVSWKDEESDVVHLSEEDFKPFLKKKKHVLVMFYAPWCGHCKRAKPEMTAAAAEFEEDTKVELAAVDCTTDKSVCSAFEVTGFPTFKYFHYYNKEQKPYDGGRTKKDFVAFLSDPLSPFAGQSPPPPGAEEQWQDLEGAIFVKHLKSAEFDHYMKYKETVLVMFYAPWCGHCKAMKADYAKAAQELTEAGVSHVLGAVDATAETELGQRFAVRGYPTLKFFTRGVEVEDYKGGRNREDIVTYVTKKAASVRNEL